MVRSGCGHQETRTAELYQASAGLRNKIRKQLYESEQKDMLPPVILMDKYIDDCLNNDTDVRMDDYFVDITNINLDTCRISFIVRPKIMPESAIVFITGSHAQLGNWKPDEILLSKASDGSWKGTFTFEKDIGIEYKFTRGNW